MNFASAPRTSDTSNFVNWQPSALINEKLRKQEKLNSNRAYRAYLQGNADSIRQFDWLVANRECSNYAVSARSDVNVSGNKIPFGKAVSDLKENYFAQLKNL